MKTVMTIGAFMGGMSLLMLALGTQSSEASPAGQSAMIIPLPQATIVPTLDPRTPTTTPYPTVPPQGTPGTGRMFDDPTFERVWRRTDWVVLRGDVKRSFFWGPGVLTENLVEEYAEGVGGRRAVQYFDKSRMEINNPNANRNDPFFVTNGLLTVEMIQGRMQVGNNAFRQSYPARIALASDHDDAAAPTYASFATTLRNEANRTGQVVGAGIAKEGPVPPERVPARYAQYGVKYARHVPETSHNIPDIFWEFINQRGPVWVDDGNNSIRVEQLIQPWYYATGYPIAEAYWATVKIEGRSDTDVLIQPYQRRVLTYVPSAPEGFKVQMGNIGRHYYDWRYSGAGQPGPIPYCQDAQVPEPFNTLWRGNMVVQNQLLCPGGTGQVNVQIQHFERGHILYVERYFTQDRDTSAANGPNFVLSDDKRVTYYFEDRKLGDPGPQEEPPRGLLRPTGEPGKLWRESKQARDMLGWATSPLKDIRPEERHFFQRGLMVADLNAIFLFYNEELFHWAYPKNWDAYLVPGSAIPPLEPVRGCPQSAPGEFGRLWSENLIVQNGLKCATANPQVNVAFQPFRFGAMVYVDYQGGAPGGSVPAKAIYVLYSDGRVEWFEDTYRAGDPEPTQPVPPGSGLIVPRFGFGKVWREKNLGPTIGYATAPESSLSGNNIQFFQSGFMVRDTLSFRSPIYSLVSTPTGNYAEARTWFRYRTP